MNFGIGLTGLKAAQSAIELIGTNLANAATPGYHRQELIVSPLELSNPGQKVAVGGVQVIGVQRSYDILLEREYIRQQPVQGQLEQELEALTSIVNVLGQVEGDALSRSLQDYFGAMTQLASDPNSLAYAQNTVWTADAMTTNIRNAQSFLENMKDQVFRQATQLTDEVNLRADNIAKLNGEIELSMQRGTSANLLLDQRDQAVMEVSQLAETYVQDKPDSEGQIQIQTWGTPLVLGERVMKIDVGVTSGGKLGISPEGQLTYNTESRGGKLGGLLSLYNEIIPDLQNRLDTMAKEIMLSVNTIHAQGVGAEGAFTDLTGVPVDTNTPISEWDWPPVTAGESFHLRVTDNAGNVTLHEIEILAEDTIDDIADRINALSSAPDITASVISGRLHIEAITDGWGFDFRPDYTLSSDARKETFWGVGTDDAAALNYVTGQNAGDKLTFDLGTYSFDVAIDANSLTLNDLVTDINTAATAAAGALWEPASAELDPATGQYKLRVQAWDAGNLSDTDMSFTNTGAVIWANSGEVIAEGDANLKRIDGITGLDGTGGGTFAPSIDLDGVYEGPNQEYMVTVTGVTGEVGNAANLKLNVINGNGDFITQLNVGNGYSVGDRIEVEEGLVITLSRGQLNAGETFVIDARSNSDTSGFLVAAGMNTFFHGIDSSDIEVREEFYSDAHRIATSLSTTAVDSKNIERLALLGDTRLAGLGDATISDYHRDWVSDIGQQTLVRESRLEASEAVMNQLANQRDTVSGVDPNEQAAQMLIYERMFQSMSKFISVQDKSLQTLMDII